MIFFFLGLGVTLVVFFLTGEGVALERLARRSAMAMFLVTLPLALVLLIFPESVLMIFGEEF